MEKNLSQFIRGNTTNRNYFSNFAKLFCSLISKCGLQINCRLPGYEELSSFCRMRINYSTNSTVYFSRYFFFHGKTFMLIYFWVGTRLLNLSQMDILKSTVLSQVQWLVPVTPVTLEANKADHLRPGVENKKTTAIEISWCNILTL